jgi:hypothetical protein
MRYWPSLTSPVVIARQLLLRRRQDWQLHIRLRQRLPAVLIATLLCPQRSIANGTLLDALDHSCSKHSAYA